jgi:hypothetical protein
MTPYKRGAIDKILEQMRAAPAGVRFMDLRRVCDHYFGPPRASGTSHLVYKMPWPGGPRVNIRNAGGQAKTYQVRQVLLAVDRMDHERADTK